MRYPLPGVGGFHSGGGGFTPAAGAILGVSGQGSEESARRETSLRRIGAQKAAHQDALPRCHSKCREFVIAVFNNSALIKGSVPCL